MRAESWNSSVARPLPPSEVSGRSRKKEKILVHKNISVREKMLYLCSVIICVALVLVVISMHARITELNLSIRKLDNQVQEANKMTRQLEVEKERLSSINHIRGFAEMKGLELNLPQVLPSIHP